MLLDRALPAADPELISFVAAHLGSHGVLSASDWAEVEAADARLTALVLDGLGQRLTTVQMARVQNALRERSAVPSFVQPASAAAVSKPALLSTPHRKLGSWPLLSVLLWHHFQLGTRSWRPFEFMTHPMHTRR